MYYNKCPKCGGELISKYHTDNDSYYLECENNGYNCWHEHCSKETALNYPLTVIPPKDEALALRMREAIKDDDIDYYHE